MKDQERNLLQQIGRTSRAMYAAFESQVGHALPKWRILQALAEEQIASQRQLARHLHIDPGALTRQMKALEADGLITRETDPADNRLTTVALSAAGRALLAHAQPRRKAFTRKALHGVQADRIETAMALLKELEDRFRHMQNM